MENKNHTNKEDKEPMKLKGFNHLIFAVLIFIIAAVLYFNTAGYNGESLDKFAFLLLKKSMTVLFCILLTIFWRTKKYDTDWRVAKEPLAIAVYHGLMFVAVGFS